MIADYIYALDDPGDRWTAADKEAHGLGAALAVVTFTLWGWGPYESVLGAFALGLLVETVEVARWRLLGTLGRLAVLTGGRPWPWLCDRLSFKDLAVNVGGCALGVLLCSVRG